MRFWSLDVTVKPTDSTCDVNRRQPTEPPGSSEPHRWGSGTGGGLAFTPWTWWCHKGHQRVKSHTNNPLLVLDQMWSFLHQGRERERGWRRRRGRESVQIQSTEELLLTTWTISFPFRLSAVMKWINAAWCRTWSIIKALIKKHSAWMNNSQQLIGIKKKECKKKKSSSTFSSLSINLQVPTAENLLLDVLFMSLIFFHEPSAKIRIIQKKKINAVHLKTHFYSFIYLRVFWTCKNTAAGQEGRRKKRWSRTKWFFFLPYR